MYTTLLNSIFFYPVDIGLLATIFDGIQHYLIMRDVTLQHFMLCCAIWCYATSYKDMLQLFTNNKIMYTYK